MDGGHRPAAQLETVSVLEHDLGRALKDLIALRIEALGKGAGLGGQVLPDHLRGKGEAPVQPVPLRLVDGDGVEVAVPADVVPVDVGSGGCDGQAGQLPDHRPDVRHPQPGVQEQGPLRAQQEVGVGLLPMPVFADGEGVRLELLYGEPAGHVTAPGPRTGPAPAACP